MHDEPEPLFPEAGAKAGDHEVAGAGVAQEDLPLGVGVQGVHVVHQLPPAQRHPPINISINLL